MANQGQIAPHEGEEIARLLDGSKPLAVIEKRKQMGAYVRLREGVEGLVVRFRKQPFTGYEAIAVKDGNEQLIDVYREAVRLPESPLKHRILGHLFGYSPEDIETFINNPPACGCDKCRSGEAVAA